MFGWLRKRRARMQPEARWTTVVMQDSIRVTDPAGGMREVRKADLSGVIIETNDTGPGGADIWWLLFGRDERLACAFPQGASDGQIVIDFLMTLPNFDFRQMVEAVSSTSNAVFPAWRQSQP